MDPSRVKADVDGIMGGENTKDNNAFLPLSFISKHPCKMMLKTSDRHMYDEGT